MAIIRIGINGFGRIGRNILRALYESNQYQNLQVAAINDLGNAQTNAHLLTYDSAHGRFAGSVSHAGTQLVVNGHSIELLQQRDPSRLPWHELKVDLVLECTGLFTNRSQAATHLQAGASKVIVSAPGKDMDATIVYGVNHQQLDGSEQIISNASCTTNCLAPIAKVLDQAIGIESGLMTTIHAYTNDQHLCDVYHQDLYRARSATQSMIPTKTGAAAAVGLVLPQLAGRLDGMAVRVPTANVSLVDLTFNCSHTTSIEEVNTAIATALTEDPELARVMALVHQPLVSVDFNHNPYSCCFDTNHTRVNGTLVKVMAWYDNEWAFANRMLDTSLALMSH